MKIYILSRLIKDSIICIKRNPIYSITALILSSVTFFMLGAAVALQLNVDHNLIRIHMMPEAEVFLYNDADKETISSLEEKLLNTHGVISVEFIDKQTAFERAQKIMGGESKLLDLLGEDFLPESFLVDIDNESDQSSVIFIISGFDEVESINYSENETEFINRVSTITRKIANIGIIAAALLAFIAISSLIKVAVNNREREIKIKRYLGANKTFIMLPFVFEGVIISFIGSIVAYLALSFAYIKIADGYARMFSGLAFNFFEVLPLVDFRSLLLLIIVFAALTFGLFAGILAVIRHLKSGGLWIAPN